MKKIQILFRKSLPLIFLLICCLPAMLPLLKNGFFTMHDDQQIARLYQLDQALRAGQLPPRWAADLGFGYGYPLFVFYPPLIYYLGELFHLLLKTSFIDSIKLVFAFSFFGSAVFMYLWVKDHFSSKAGILASLFYTYAPYHAVDAYVRGALAELTAFVFIPAVLWVADLLLIKKRQNAKIWLGIFLALLMLTHNLIFLAFTPIFLIYLLLLLSRNKEKKSAVKNLIFSLAMALGLSAFFFLPALWEKKYSLVDDILLTELASYRLHFVYPHQLFNSLWGYGGSTAGPLDGISFKIGKLHLLLSCLLAPVFLLAGRKGIKAKAVTGKTAQVILVTFLFFLSAFLTTAYSAFIWEIAKPLQYLQFPWRFLTFTALFSSFLAGASVWLVGKLKPSLQLAFFLLFATLLFYPNFRLFQPQQYLAVDDNYYLTDDFLKWKISKTSFEFIPKGVKTRVERNEIEGVDITQVALNRDQIAVSPYQIISGSPQLEIKKQASGFLLLQSRSSESTLIRLNSFDFPGWQVVVDGEKTSFQSDNDLRLITFELQSGEHLIKACFKNTPVRTFANLVSLFSLLYLLKISLLSNVKFKNIFQVT